MIQAYEKLCVEKADLESELGEMVGTVGTALWGQHCGDGTVGLHGPLPQPEKSIPVPASCGGRW